MSALEQLEEKSKRGIATELDLCVLMAGSLNDRRHAALELEKLHADLASANSRLVDMGTTMSCGHLARYVVSAAEGTQYCLLCAMEATEQTILNLIKDES